jgi:hypothetical protein
MGRGQNGKGYLVWTDAAHESSGEELGFSVFETDKQGADL